jgi:hypothetical protein
LASCAQKARRAASSRIYTPLPENEGSDSPEIHFATVLSPRGVM